MNLNPSATDAAGISARESHFVKPCVAILSALPVIAVAASQRRFGLVCLSPRLAVLAAKTRCLHRHRSHRDRIRVICDVLEQVVTHTCPPTIVLEDEGCVPRSTRIARSKIVDWADKKGLRIVRLSRRDACVEVCGNTDLRAAALHIAQRYSILANELGSYGNASRPRFKRWQSRQPFVTAFILAHAFAARSVIKTFGGEIPALQTSQYHDPKFP